MGRLDDIDTAITNQHRQYKIVRQDMEGNLARIKRLEKFAEDTPAYLKTLNEEFENKTSLTDREVAIMFVMVGLQFLRQHFLTNFNERVDDKSGGKNDPFHGGKYLDRNHEYYNPSFEEILNNPVPFDANRGANGALSGGGMLGHRATAIGHDPLLGLIFGTANIATSTLTNKDFASYHIVTDNRMDSFSGEKASTILVLQKTAEKFFEGSEGLKKLVFLLLKNLRISTQT